ncbi:MAG: EF-hand domain-containing protein [Spirochaetes bacterium]|nr:EF-hand domain-containing protein [Spirochaetota bacterium]
MKQNIIIALSSIVFISLMIAFVLLSGPERTGITPGRHAEPLPVFGIQTGTDGRISKKSWVSHFSSVFDAMDADKNGIIVSADIEKHNASSSDRQGPPRPPADSLVRRIDENGDGKLSRTEWIKHHEALFDRFDADKNGHLDANEIPKGPGPGGPGPERGPRE